MLFFHIYVKDLIEMIYLVVHISLRYKIIYLGKVSIVIRYIFIQTTTEFE